MASSSGGNSSWKHVKRGHHHRSPNTHHHHNRHHNNKVASFSPEVQVEIKNLFEKKFDFEKPGSEDVPWSLPSAEKLFSTTCLHCFDPVLQGFKDELNTLKSRLSDKEIRQWHQHTSTTHRSGLVMQHLRSQLHVELCTQAWCKFHEIVSAYSIVPRSDEHHHVNTVHLCEAPGAFVTSLNHYLKRWKGAHAMHWQWLATTLNPYYEGNSTDAMISDDRFILLTPQNWDFGADNSGDLMNPENYDALVESVGVKMGAVNLVTADGSINCQNDPAEQESVVSQLHYCETITALSILSPGGAFVLKMFTMFEHSTVCLMYLLNCVFQKVHVFKPATSKSGNSEVYVVCEQYSGTELLKDHMDVLRRVFGPSFPGEALFAPDHIPESFVKQLQSCAKQFKTYQMTTIMENIELFGNMTEDKHQHLEDLRACCVQEYVERYHMRSIKKSEKIRPNPKITRSMQSGFAHGMFIKTINKQLSGTFYERVEDSRKGWLDKITTHIDKDDTQVEACIRADMQNMRELTESEIQSWTLLEGRSLTHVRSSPFCAAHVLDDWNLACRESQVFKHHTSSGSLCSTDVSGASTDLQPIMKVIQESKSRLNQITSGGPLSCICLLSSSSHHSFIQQLTQAKLLPKVLKVQYNTDDTSAIEIVDYLKEDPSLNEDSWILQAEHMTDYQAMLRLANSLQSLKLPMLYVDCRDYDTSPHSQSELPSRLRIFTSLLLAVQAMRVGGVLMLHVPMLLTRFSVGVLYVLHRIFTQVTLLGKSKDQGLTHDTYVICQSYQGAYPALTQFLWDVYNSLVSTPMGSTDREILQLIPIPDLCESSFNQVITTFNCKLLSQQTKTIVMAELGETNK